MPRIEGIRCRWQSRPPTPVERTVPVDLWGKMVYSVGVDGGGASLFREPSPTPSQPWKAGNRKAGNRHRLWPSGPAPVLRVCYPSFFPTAVFYEIRNPTVD